MLRLSSETPNTCPRTPAIGDPASPAGGASFPPVAGRRWRNLPSDMDKSELIERSEDQRYSDSDVFVDATSEFDINFIDTHDLIEHEPQSSSSAGQSSSSMHTITEPEPDMTFFAVEHHGFGSVLGNGVEQNEVPACSERSLLAAATGGRPSKLSTLMVVSEALRFLAEEALERVLGGRNLGAEASMRALLLVSSGFSFLAMRSLRALRFITLKEDRKIQEKADVTPGYGSFNRKSESAHRRSQRPKPYSKPDNPRVNKVDQGEDEDDEEYPTFNEFCFATYIAGVINAMQDLGDKARWPKKTEKQASWKDKSKWCAYHEDFGHLTEDCIAMRKEISYLLSKGFLKELLGRKKDRSRGTDQSAKSRGTNQTMDAERSRGHPEQAASPSPDAKDIYFISGGSDICGRYLGEDDRCNVMDPHHDGLVITLYISNHFVKRILIDGGSSANIIQLETLTKMGIPQDEVIAKSMVLVGFSGETKNTLGEVKLPVYVERVNSMQRFCVMDAPSGYNIILGRPWIHDMIVVPSTYHQCVKLPTPWGVVTIHSDQQEAKDCYTSAMNISTKACQG
ncbi:hypothetical protein SSX86_003833 [Deinandra increscens subsp. villosa]|uniref:Gag-pol polyprotein n=1 Tax=Deinandra increscens subsp. villosa TaxID=3103831 RepID=A0AAP0H747_9ASTR